MNVDQALIILDSILNLTNIEEMIIRKSWDYQDYESIAKEINYDREYIKGCGAALWKKISKKTGVHTTKANFKVVVRNLYENSRGI